MLSVSPGRELALAQRGLRLPEVPLRESYRCGCCRGPMPIDRSTWILCPAGRDAGDDGFVILCSRECDAQFSGGRRP